MKKTKASRKATPAKKHSHTFKNVLLLLATIFVLLVIKKSSRPYSWLFDDLLNSTAEKIDDVAELSYKQKMEARFGFDYSYFTYINQNTPENAIILMPPDEIILQKTKDGNNLSKYMATRIWVNYFVYPRRLVYSDHLEDYELTMDSITHIAIVHGWGYHLVDKEYPAKNQFDVISFEQ